MLLLDPVQPDGQHWALAPRGCTRLGACLLRRQELLVGTLEVLLRRPMRLCATIDAQTGIAAIKKGYSRKMAYLKKWKRVSISALHDVYVGENPSYEPDDAFSINRLLHISGERNGSDLLTKPMPHPRHWQLLGMLKMMKLSRDQIPPEILQQ